ncbi:MAG: putative toxin-antitoxin system toxin component, PIN family [Proteobacteria bacterium]|nr:putative toxin-antitoxin system toxin component, PIN family [Pseudomonadota bacterium]HQR04124.1 putative toxin-antitoxin system toxin component, PIN family [Rhodocyclaceae bacterium]
MVTQRVVFDTNVLLSLWAFADSRYAPLRGEVEAGRWTALTRTDCLAEFRRVLGYPRFRLSDARQEALWADYAAASICVTAAVDAPPLPRCQDRDDQKFLEVARDGQAHCLVTGDKLLLKLARRQKMQHLFRIITPDVALAELQAHCG